jgi:hypothetical protein
VIRLHKGTLGSLGAFMLVGFVAGVVAASSAAHAASSTSGTWMRTGSMTTPREGQTAVLLANGQVLVMAGTNSNGALSSAELFNPATGKFSATGDMGAARGSFTATALPNGQALVTGGDVAGAATSSAELFNPATGTFSQTGSMTVPRERGTATLLPNGKVLVAGGDNSSGDLQSAELFNPATGTFSPTGSMNVARPTANATLLPNGQVLVAGGATCCNNGCCSGGSAELYNPNAETWALTGSMSFPRYGPLAGLLPNGQVLEVCNISDPGVPRCGAEVYTPASGTWSQDGAASPSAEGSYAYTMLNNGEVLISGGQNVFGVDQQTHVLQSDATLFDPTTGNSTSTGSMSIPREDHTLTLLPNGQMLAAGGYTQNNKGKITVTASAELFTP